MNEDDMVFILRESISSGRATLTIRWEEANESMTCTNKYEKYQQCIHIMSTEPHGPCQIKGLTHYLDQDPAKWKDQRKDQRSWSSMDLGTGVKCGQLSELLG